MYDCIEIDRDIINSAQSLNIPWELVEPRYQGEYKSDEVYIIETADDYGVRSQPHKFQSANGHYFLTEGGV